MNYHWKSEELTKCNAIPKRSLESSSELRWSPVNSGEVRFCCVSAQPQATFSCWILRTIMNNHRLLAFLLPLRLAAGTFFDNNRSEQVKKYCNCFIPFDSAAGAVFHVNTVQKRLKSYYIVSICIKWLNVVVFDWILTTKESLHCSEGE